MYFYSKAIIYFKYNFEILVYLKNMKTKVTPEVLNMTDNALVPEVELSKI